MRRPVLLLVLLVVAPLFGVSEASARAASTPLAATLGACKVATAPAGGSVTFVGSMPAIAGAATMEMRFELLQATVETGAFKTVAVPAWTAWVKTAQSGKPGFVYKKKVLALSGPAIYKALIHFRWRNAAGKVIRKVQRRTPGCKQPDLRPNLEVLGVTADPTGPDRADYRVIVRNSGRMPASMVAVRLGMPGVDARTASIAILAGKTRTVALVNAPRCVAGTTVDLAVDPDNGIAESDETDNAITVACPLKD